MDWKQTVKTKARRLFSRRGALPGWGALVLAVWNRIGDADTAFAAPALISTTWDFLASPLGFYVVLISGLVWLGWLVLRPETKDSPKLKLEKVASRIEETNVNLHNLINDSKKQTGEVLDGFIATIKSLQDQINRLERNLGNAQKEWAAKSIEGNKGIAVTGDDATMLGQFSVNPDTGRVHIGEPSLSVDVKMCRWDTDGSRSYGATVLAVEAVFHPENPPIQLASGELLFEGQSHKSVDMPTKLIERDHAETYLFEVGGETVAKRLMKMGFDQGESSPLHPVATAISWDEWPKAQLRVVAGALDFKTEPFLAPTPTKPLAPDIGGSPM